MAAAIRHDWQHDELQALFELPLPDPVSYTHLTLPTILLV